MKKLILTVVAFLFVFFTPFFNPHTVNAQNTQSSSIMESVINDVQSIKRSGRTIKSVTATIISGKLFGRQVKIEDNVLPTSNTLTYQKGDHVILTYSKNPSGKEFFYITDYDRKPALITLTILFVLAILLVARKQGVAAIISMIITFFFIVKLIIPPILNGNNPLTITLIISFFVIPITYYITHGFHKKTTVAIAATAITLILVGILSYFFSIFAKLTGFSSEEAAFLQNMKSSINIQSILLSGIIIGGLAVLNDITIGQASTVASLHASNPRLTRHELYNHAMSVGRDHVASLVDTLVLVYAGAALPLFLLFYRSPVELSLIINQEVIATEIVRTLVTSIGIIAAVPVTTYLACLFEKS